MWFVFSVLILKGETMLVGKERTLVTKNRKTKKAETIVMQDMATTDWGFHFFVGTELEAYKAAYEYRNSKHGVKVEFAGGAQCWMVTVFNEFAKTAGIDGAQ